MKNKLPIFFFSFLILQTSVNAQTWQGGNETTTVNGGTSFSVAHSNWGNQLGLLFNAYSPGPDGGFFTITPGTVKNKFGAGSYASGAGGIVFTANGGRMDFFVAPISEGATSNVNWGVPKLSIMRSGNIGIGVSEPANLLELNTNGAGTFNFYGNSSNFIGADINISRTNSGTGVGRAPTLQFNDAVNSAFNIIQASHGGLQFFNNYQPGAGGSGGWTERLRILPNGNVGIGTTDPRSFKLAVEGKIWAQEVNVSLTTPGPDYVFESDYHLMPLAELETYIRSNKHLPEVPSAIEMEKEGLNLMEMNLILLKKVEEITLHLIEVKKQNDRLQIELDNLKSGK